MIKAGDRVIYNERSDYGECEGIPSLKTVEEVIETKNNIYYKLYGIDGLIFEDDIEEILPEKKDGLYVTVGCDTKLIKGIRDTISEAVCELQEYATNEHSYYTADGKEMLSTWKMVNGVPTDVHEFEKVSPSNWKQLS